MVRLISPNKAILFAVLSFLAYWVAALFVPATLLRDIFNALAFGTALLIVITWWTAAVGAVRKGADSGESQLILAIFLIWFVVVCQRVYVVVFNMYGEPDSWRAMPISGFWPYSFMIAGMLFLAAPGVKGGAVEVKTIWTIIAAVAVGSMAAGILIGTQISTG